MPISRNEFDAGQSPDSWENTILGFLNSHPKEAFSALEVGRAVGYPISPIVGAMSLHAILHRMAEHGRIEERVVRTGRRSDNFYAAIP